MSAFRNYTGPSPAFSNVTRRSGPVVVTYFDRLKEANRALGEVINATYARLKSKTASGDVESLIDTVGKQIVQINSVPRVDAESDQYKNRLLELLNEQKRILEELRKESANDLGALAKEEETLRNRYSEFVSDYTKWLPGFLKKHGYELGERK